MKGWFRGLANAEAAFKAFRPRSGQTPEKPFEFLSFG
jgi:hypothetical protein